MDRGRGYNLPYNRFQQPRFQNPGHQSSYSNVANPRLRPYTIPTRISRPMFQPRQARSAPNSSSPNLCYNISIQDSFTRNSQCHSHQFSENLQLEQNRCRPNLSTLNSPYRARFQDACQHNIRSEFSNTSCGKWSSRNTVSGGRSSPYSRTREQHHDKVTKQSLNLVSTTKQNYADHINKTTNKNDVVNENMTSNKNDTVHENIVTNKNEVVHEKCVTNTNESVCEKNKNLVHENIKTPIHENNEPTHRKEQVLENDNESVHEICNKPTEIIHDNPVSNVLSERTTDCSEPDSNVTVNVSGNKDKLVMTADNLMETHDKVESDNIGEDVGDNNKINDGDDDEVVTGDCYNNDDADRNNDDGDVDLLSDDKVESVSVAAADNDDDDDEVVTGDCYNNDDADSNSDDGDVDLLSDDKVESVSVAAAADDDDAYDYDDDDDENSDSSDDDYLPPTFLPSVKPKHISYQTPHNGDKDDDDDDDVSMETKKSFYTLDNLYKDHQNKVVQVKDSNDFNDELQNDLKQGGFLNLFVNEENITEDSLTDKQNDILEQYEYKESKLKNEWPGRELFKSETYQCLFNGSLRPSHCGYIVPDKPSRLERHIGSLSAGQYKFFLTSKLHVQLFMKITDLPNFLRWLYLLMSVSDDVDILNGCKELLLNVLHTQYEDGTTKWTPSFIDFISILVNYGASLESLLPWSHSEVEVMRNTLVKQPEYDIPVHQPNVQSPRMLMNLISVIKVLAQALNDQIGKYSANECSSLVYILCRISLDPSTKSCPYTVETIQQCLTCVLQQYTDSDWLMERLGLSRMLVNVSSHHHDQCRVALILPPGERGFYLQQRYCYLVITQILTSGKLEISDSDLDNFEIGYLEKFIHYITELIQNDPYVLTSVIRMIGLCVGVNYSHSTKTMEQLKSLTEKLSRIRIKDDIGMLDRSRVQNMIVIITGIWTLDIQSHRWKQGHLFEYSSNNSNRNEEMLVETLKTAESDNDDYNGDDDDDTIDDNDSDETSTRKKRKLCNQDNYEPNTMDTTDMDKKDTVKNNAKNIDELSATISDKLNDEEYDKPSFDDTDKLITMDTDKLTTMDTDKLITMDTDKLKTMDTDKLKTMDSDDLITTDTDKLITTDTDKLITTDTDKLITVCTDKLNTTDSDDLITTDTDKLITTDTDKLITMGTDKLITWDTDKLITTDTDKLITMGTDKLITWDTDKLITRETDKPITTDTDKLITKDPDKLITVCTDKPITTDTDKPITTDTDKLITVCTDKLITVCTDKQSPKVSDEVCAFDTETNKVNDGLKAEDYNSDISIKENYISDVLDDVDHISDEAMEVNNDNYIDLSDVKTVQDFVEATAKLSSYKDYKLNKCYVLVKKIEWE